MTVKAWNWLEWRSWKKVESLLTSVPLLGARKTRTGNATYKMAWSLKVIQNRMVGPLFNAWRIRESWEEKVTLANSSGMRQVGHLIYCAIVRSWAFWGDKENLFRSMVKREGQSGSVQLLSRVWMKWEDSNNHHRCYLMNIWLKDSSVRESWRRWYCATMT